MYECVCVCVCVCACVCVSSLVTSTTRLVPGPNSLPPRSGTLFAHALNFPEFWEFRYYRIVSVYDYVTFAYKSINVSVSQSCK